MVQLIANNKTIDIDNISFNITRRSPINSANNGSFIYSITVPYSDNNAAIFGFPLRLQRKDKQRKTVNGDILYNGHIIQTGSWQAKTTGEETISLEMLIDAGMFADSIENKKLPDLFDVPVSVTDIVSHVNGQVTKTWPEVNHNFPVIYNPGFYGDPKETDPDKNKNPQFEGFLNNAIKTGLVTNNTANKNTIVPQLYLAYIIQHIYSQAGYTIKGTVLQDDMIKRALLYSNFALDKLLATAFNGDAYGNTVSPDFAIIGNTALSDPGNLYDNITGEYTVMIAGDYQANISGTFAPIITDIPPGYAFHLEIYYDNVLKNSKYITIKDTTAFSTNLDTLLTIDAADAGKKITFKAWFTDTSTTDPANMAPASISIVNTTQQNANIFVNSFNYKDIVPNISVKDFLNLFFKTFNILPFINQNTQTVEMIFFDDLLTKSKAEDFPEGLLKNSLKITSNNYQGVTFNFNFTGSDNLKKETKTQTSLGTVTIFSFPTSTPGDVYYCESLNAYFRRDYNKDAARFEWIAIGDRHPDYKIDDGVEQISLQLAPMLMRNPQYNAYVTRNLPAIDAEGTSDAYQIKNDIPIRIMFWIGIVPRGVDGDYPFATTTKYDNDGAVVLPISWELEDIQSRYFNEYIAWLKSRENVEFTNTFTAADMAVINFQTAYFFQYALIILEEEYIKISNQQFGPANIKGWTV